MYARLASLLVWGALFAAAQSNLGSLTGIISDPSGATIAGAELTVTNAGTGIQVRGRSNAEGVYLIPALAPAPYTVEVQAAGFKRKTVRNLVIDAGQRARQDLSLEVGDMVQAVEIQAAVTPLNPESAEVSETITSKDIINMPLNGRVPYSLLALTPGVSAAGNDPSSLSYDSGLSLNGSRKGGTAYVVDGASTTHIGGIGERVGSIETIQEFKVLASTYSAEFGRTSGGVISFQVKSGTKDFHGSLYEFHRNTILNANSWENNARGVERGKLLRNEFGVTGGGAVPGMRQRMFYFLAYEGIRDSIPTLLQRTIPDRAIRGGNFAGMPVTIYDPAAGNAPFPGNAIPPARQDSAAAKLVALIPDANTGGNFNSRYGIATNNYLRQAGGSDNKNFGTMRWDFSPTDLDKVFFTYSHVNEGPRDQVRDFLNALNTTGGPRFRNIRRFALGYTRIFTPAVSNELLLSLQRDPRKIDPWYPDFNVTSELGMVNRIGETLPSISMSGGFSSFGNSNYQDWVHQPGSISNIVSLQKARHSLRLGAQLYQNQFWYIAANNISGSYNFNGELTGRGTEGRNNPVNSFADFLLGAVKTASYPVPQIPLTRFNYNLGLFVQDDWKVTPRLTLNLGLRYEFETKQAVKNNVYSRVELGTGKLLVAGRNASGNLNVQNDLLNFSPRIGAAYKLNDRTVLRSGFGIFHSNFWVDNGEMVAYPGWTNAQSFVDQGVGRAQPFTFRQGFPVDGASTAVPDPLALAAAATVARPLAVSSLTYDGGDRMPMVLQWNVGVQREVGFDTVAEIAYVASRSTHLARNVPSNSPPLSRSADVSINRVPIQQVRPYPTFSAFNAVLYDAMSSYHSLQLKATRRFSRGFSLDANYTWSKNIDTASNEADSFQIPWQFASIERSLSSLDRPHSFMLGAIYELPFGKGKRWANQGGVIHYLAGGWQVNVMYSVASGLPFTITQTNTNLILAAQRPDVSDPRNISGRGPEAFEGVSRRYLIAPGQAGFPFRVSSNTGIGNLGRNTSREAGYRNWNLSLFKSIPITERVRFELRLEGYNALNAVNWREPSSANIDNANYGLITATAPPRQVQIGGRLSW